MAFGVGTVSSCLFFNAQAAIAQPSGMSSYLTDPMFGATAGVSLSPGTPKFGIQKNLFTQRHTTPAGKPCVSIHASSQAQIVNTKLYDHILLLNNECNQPIKLMICYYRTRNCHASTIAAYKRERRLFGLGSEKDFRFEYREYVN